MFRIQIILAVLVLSATAVIAQADVNAERKEFMKTYGKHGYGNLNRMVRDQMPYDQAKVDEALAHFIETAPKIASLFPAGGYQGPAPDSNYYANAKAFENQDDLKTRSEKFAEAIAGVNGKIKDLDSLKASWPELNKNHCDSCHQEYRVRKQS
jgi:cytochrome c556